MTYGGFVQAGLQIGIDSILVRPKRGLFNIIAGDNSALPDIIAHATVEELHSDELEITDHPVEQGASISDHAFKLPAQVVLHLAWSNSPNKGAGLVGAAVGAAATANATARAAANVLGVAVGAAQAFTAVQATLNGTAVGQMNAVYASLLKLQATKALFDVYTGKRVYTNMICKAVSAPTDYKSENALFITMVCRQLIIVNTQTVALPKNTQANADQTASPTNNGFLAAVPVPDIPVPSLAGYQPQGTW